MQAIGVSLENVDARAQAALPAGLEPAGGEPGGHEGPAPSPSVFGLSVFCKTAAGLALAAGVLAAGLAPAFASSSVTRVSAFEYDPVTGFLTKEIIEPDDPAFRVETAYTHDAFGNRVSAAVSGGDIATRTSQTTFDATGRFAVIAENALGHEETRSFDARYGEALSLTGPNGLTTSWEYDSFGRKVKEIRADGTATSIAYLYCSGYAGGTEPCPALARYLVRTVPLDAGDQQNGPWTKTYFDVRGREIRKETQGPDGSVIRVETEYDADGRVHRSSLPHYAGDTVHWTTATYDLLDRVLTETRPDSSVTSYSYSGLTTTITNAEGQVRIETKNAQGQLASVTDDENQTITYTYDASGNLVSTADPVGNVIAASFDKAGRRTSLDDPNLGLQQFAYNVLGELVWQKDAKDQETVFTYDLLGRMLTRVEADLVSAWEYDTAAQGIGKLARVTTDQDYERTHTYDSLGRPSQTTWQLETGMLGSSLVTYDAQGRVDEVVNPSGLRIAHVYNALGFHTETRNGDTNALYWKFLSMDALGNVTGQEYGNGIVTTKTYEAETGFLTHIAARSAGAGYDDIQSHTYTYDALSNLTGRTDHLQGLAENFAYDNLNRLTSAEIQGGATKSFAYDGLGNIVSKSDTGSYAYGAPGGARPHAVTAISGTVNTSFTYDANGNMVSGGGRTIAWTSFDMPSLITRGSASIGFTYGPGHERIIQSAGARAIYYFSLAQGAHAEQEVDAVTGQVKWSTYLYAGGAMVGVVEEVIEAAAPTVEIETVRYFHLDHLGSIAKITDAAGQVAENLSFDPWGKRRFTSGADDPLETILSGERRGFTGHEHLAAVGLVHMNGRIYDPLIGRFLSADPFVKDPKNLQNLNRYSYVNNNPLSFTDPTGYFIKKLFKAVTGIARKIHRAIKGVIRSAIRALPQPVAQIAVVVGSVWACGPGAPACAAAFSAAGSYEISRAHGVSVGRAFRGAVFAAASAMVAAGIGDLAETGTLAMDNIYVRSLAHGSTQGGLAVAEGGNFKDAFLAGVFATYFGDRLDQNIKGNPVAGTVANAVIGGTASTLGGGSFANGAVTGAFIYAFNCYQHPACRGGEEFNQQLNDAISERLTDLRYQLEQGWETGAIQYAGSFVGPGALFKGYDLYKLYQAKNFFAGTAYTEKVLMQMRMDIFHGFPASVEAFASAGKAMRIVGGDGVARSKLSIPGSLRGKPGKFEFIKSRDGSINHRFFEAQ